MTNLLLSQEKKSKYKPKIESYDDWHEQNPQYMIEFRLWCLETDLTHIELYGLRFAVQTLGFRDWINWRLQSELDEVTEEITEDAQFEEITIC